jgi:hypothetical protein
LWGAGLVDRRTKSPLRRWANRAETSSSIPGRTVVDGPVLDVPIGRCSLSPDGRWISFLNLRSIGSPRSGLEHLLRRTSGSSFTQSSPRLRVAKPGGQPTGRLIYLLLAVARAGRLSLPLRPTIRSREGCSQGELFLLHHSHDPRSQWGSPHSVTRLQAGCSFTITGRRPEASG